MPSMTMSRSIRSKDCSWAIRRASGPFDASKVANPSLDKTLEIVLRTNFSSSTINIFAASKVVASVRKFIFYLMSLGKREKHFLLYHILSNSTKTF